MPLVVEKYLPYLDEMEMKDNQKLICIEALWKIADATVDFACGVRSTQLFNPDEDKRSIIKFCEETSNDPMVDELLAEYEKSCKFNGDPPEGQPASLPKESQ